jgi:hypothetical protein
MNEITKCIICQHLFSDNLVGEVQDVCGLDCLIEKERIEYCVELLIQRILDDSKHLNLGKKR